MQIDRGTRTFGWIIYGFIAVLIAHSALKNYMETGEIPIIPLGVVLGLGIFGVIFQILPPSLGIGGEDTSAGTSEYGGSGDSSGGGE